MFSTIHSLGLLSFALNLISQTGAQLSDGRIVGTWSTKSRAVTTGPDFYNPVEDKLIEPSLTGFSYSFTADGFFEAALYRAVSNPATPQCPSSILQWQHGTYSISADGSITLTPIEVDGRQLMSPACGYDNAIYTRYKQVEHIKKYEVLTDKFHNVPRLNLYRFDGAPMNPMFLIATPPQMLPTQTLNPTPTAVPAGTKKVKRWMGLGPEQEVAQYQMVYEGGQEPLNKHALLEDGSGLMSELFNAERWWWVGVGLTAVGGVMYMMPTS